MIRIEQDYDQTLYIPKPAKTQELAYLVIHSELTQKDYTFEMGDVEEGDYEVDKNFYKVVIDASSIPEGEYNYTLTDEAGEEAGTGLLVIGDPETISKTIIQYGSEIEYTQYYPEIVVRPFIDVTAPESIPYGQSAFSFTIKSNVDWVYTIYRKGDQYGETTHGTAGKSVQTIIIPINETLENIWWLLSVGDEEGDIPGQDFWIMQFGIPLRVSITTPNLRIPASATTIPFTVSYNQYNSNRTGTIYLKQNFEVVQSMPLNFYPYTFSSAFTIPENTSEEEIHHILYVECPATPNAELISGVTGCFQEAAAPTPTADTSTRFSVEMLEDGDINWPGRGYEYYDIIRNGVRDEGNQLDHSIDNLKAGDIVEFYLMTDNTNRIDTPITSTAKHNVYGNVMSLCYADFENVSACTRVSQFSGMFKNDEGIVSAEYLILPEVCTDSCFMNMFNGCSSLVKAPSLPATTLKASCYAYMFQNCTSLTTAPELPASEINNSSYDTMFSGCTSLNYIKCLAESGNREGLENCRRWVSGVAASGTFVKKTGINWPNGINGIPDGWTVVNTDE